MARFKRQSELEKTIKDINDKTMYGLTIDNIRNHYAKVNNEDIFISILIRLANNPNVNSNDYMTKLAFAIDVIYPHMVTEDKDLSGFYELLNIYLSNPDLITIESLENLSNAFSDKKLIAEAYLYLNQPDLFGDLDGVNVKNIDVVTEYLIKARELYVDDRALYCSLINLIKNKLGIDLFKYGTEEEINKVISSKVKDDRKANGIYDIDEAIIREFDRKIESMGLLRERLDTLLKLAESERATLSAKVDDAKENLTNTRISEMRALNEEARKVISEFNASYMELLNKQKSSIYAEKDTLISEINDYIEKKKSELLAIVDRVSADVGIQVTRIKKASNDSIGSIKEYVATNEGINKVITEAANNATFIKRMEFVEDIASKMDNQIIAAPVVTEGATTTEQIVVPDKAIIVPTTQVDEPIDYTINYYFDKSKKYKERFKKLLERKYKLEDEGEIFHEKFDDVSAMLIENDSPYMYGPSGCGKTYLVEEQVAKLLDIEVINNGYILFEQDVIGYNNAGNGDYVRTNFYRAYRTGKGIFFDELDNSNSNATTILNPFLKRSGNTSYTFPNGVTIVRHPNFRIIAAGNTKGTGKTVAHNTRQKMDESVMQRLTPIAIGYDNRIEERILKDYPGWFEFAVAFRSALEKCPLNGNGEEVNSIGTFTTRDAETIRDYKNDGAFDDEQLMAYQIIENKDIDYLMQIKKKMESERLETEEGKKLLKIFNNQVASIHQNGKGNN